MDVAKQARLEPEEELEDKAEEEAVRSDDLSFFASFMRPYVRPYKKSLWIIAGILLIEMAFNFNFPLVTQHLIDDGLQEKNWEVVVWVLGFLFIAAVANTTLGIVSDYLYTRTATHVTRDVRQSLFDHMHQLPMPYFSQTQTGVITSRFSGDIVATETALVTVVPYFLAPALEVIYSTVLLLILSPSLGAIALIGFPLVMWLPKLFASKAFDLAYQKRKTEGRLMGAVQENISAQPVLKAFGLSKRLRDDFNGINATWFGTASRGNFQASLVERASHSGLYVLHIVVFGIGVYWVFTDSITLGALVAFEGVFLSMGYAMTDVTQYVPNLAQAVGGARHMREFLDEIPSIVDKKDALEAPYFSRSIEFDRVRFDYGAASDFCLENFSLVIPKGSMLGIVGPSGSGKSTILNLLLRFNEPTSGAIRFDDIDLRDLKQASYRRQLGVVFQESFLFNTTILENIRLGKPDASMSEIQEAARLAEVEEFILSLPQQWQTVVGERGSQLSGGQRQRVAIARALVRSPELLVLDEATSALDAATEARLNATLRRIARTRTVVSVTHRLGSVVGADRIILMEGGRIVESGTHEELLEKGGHYTVLWRTQREAPRLHSATSGDD
jgi:ATP-binding cassette, subfamily B, bacterial